jgi:TIR domain
MSHVFVSYKREDELRVGRISRALESAGLEVWWDRGLPGGESWHANIEAKLEQAGCVVVIWSYASASQDGGFVREEARRGIARNILVPVMIDRLDNLPLGFGEIQAIDLTRWSGDRRDPFFGDLLATIRAKLDHAPTPAARGPNRRVGRRMMWGTTLSGAGVTAAALFACNTFGVAARLCSLPGPQPGLSDACGTIGLGSRPNKLERMAWESRASGSCSALRDHIARFPDGAYRSQAADLLTGRTVTQIEHWLPASRTLALYESAAGKPAKDEMAARTAALARGQTSSERLCREFGAGSLYRYVSASPVAEQWACTKASGGTVCAFDGHAECKLDQLQQSEQESCR